MTRSAEYWKQRAEANMDGVQRGAEQRLARLGRAYHQAARELEGEVQRILGTYAKRFDLTPEEAAAALREPADEESRAYGYRVSRAEALEKAIRERLNGLGARLERETAAQREWTASKSYQSARKMMRDMTGGVVSQAVPDLQGLLRAMDTAWSGRNYSARVWRNTDQLAQMLEDEIEAAFLSGKSVRRMANVIMDRFGVGYRAAECLVRTETSYVQNQTAAQSYRDAGCTEYEILTASDRRTCRRCAAQNGKRYPFTAMQPGENAPPFHPNCRCTILPVVGETTRPMQGKTGPDELGFAVAKTGESGIILEGENYVSGKGFIIHQNKIQKFLLKPGAKHYEEFYSVGYGNKPGYMEREAKRLAIDIENGYDETKITERSKAPDGSEKFSIFMNLGSGNGKRFRTVWQKDTPDSKPRLITAHRER